ncbi:single-stranded DNA-binding protein [Tuberibacillus sp. Marseille-P3662]|uniref:single-stranded DNA-binding protein n=1 Tax=Tuberibacillus sp. Marseille-P3662 TaxID=1965358 RepID=UPI000A1CC673|nr:single-stranded DNA-binding protein [Tuberibacillus sp. Marseille-P3662]
MINRVVLVGRLTKDPELRYTPSGVAVANFTLAVNRPFTNQQGEREADFIQIVVWRRQAENTANFVGKGSLVGIDGRLQTRSFDNNEGRRVFMTEVVGDSVQFLEPKGSKGQSAGMNNNFGSPNPNNQTNYQQNQTSNNRPSDSDPFADDGKPIDITDDDLPF